jgi:hypothetical protein
MEWNDTFQVGKLKGDIETIDVIELLMLVPTCASDVLEGCCCFFFVYLCRVAVVYFEEAAVSIGTFVEGITQN